jgi:hypothetical protein
MRLKSTRLPNKMLLTLGGETLAARAWRLACEAFGAENCVVAVPSTDESGPLGDELRRIGARIFAWDGDENDVLGRFWACAHTVRSDPASVIYRVTPDDFPVEPWREWFTLADLDEAQHRVLANDRIAREHIGWTLPVARATAGEGVIEINSLADYEAAKAKVGK